MSGVAQRPALGRLALYNGRPTSYLNPLMNDPEDTMPGPQSASPGTLNPPLFVDAGAVAEADPAN